MATILLTIHLMVAIVLVALVLLQRSEGGALGIGGGGGMMTGRGAGNALTKATTIAAVLFFGISLTLGIIASRTGQDSLLDKVTPASVDNTDVNVAPAPLSTGSQSQKPEAPQSQSGTEAPAKPATPAAAAPAPAEPSVPKAQ